MKGVRHILPALYQATFEFYKIKEDVYVTSFKTGSKPYLAYAKGEVLMTIFFTKNPPRQKSYSTTKILSCKRTGLYGYLFDAHLKEFPDKFEKVEWRKCRYIRHHISSFYRDLMIANDFTF